MTAYCTKYDPDNPGMHEVFSRVYRTIISIEGTGITSSMVAACGEDFERYLIYGTRIASTTKSRLILVELDRARYKRISRSLRELKRKLLSRDYRVNPAYMNVIRRAQVVYGNMITYENIPGIKLLQPARVEDMGFGCRFDKLVYRAIGRLDTQKETRGYNKKSGKRLLKAQILDGSRKRVGDHRCFRLLQQYVSVIGAKIGGINGTLPSSRTDDDMQDDYIFRNGKPLGTYKDKNSKHECKVYEHDVEFIDPGRIVDMKLYTYMNGGSMLTCLVIYR